MTKIYQERIGERYLWTNDSWQMSIEKRQLGLLRNTYKRMTREKISIRKGLVTDTHEQMTCDRYLHGLHFFWISCKTPGTLQFSSRALENSWKNQIYTPYSWNSPGILCRRILYYKKSTYRFPNRLICNCCTI